MPMLTCPHCSSRLFTKDSQTLGLCISCRGINEHDPLLHNFSAARWDSAREIEQTRSFNEQGREVAEYRF